MGKEYIYFQKDVVFTGKHAKYLDALWTQNQIMDSYFNRLYELYAVAAIIGLRINRKEEIDSSSDDKRTILGTQLMSYTLLQDIMKIILLLDKTEDYTDEQRVNRAFRGPSDDEEFKGNIELFNAYARGGISYLYEELVIRSLDIDDVYTDAKLGNMMALLSNNFVAEI